MESNGLTCWHNTEIAYKNQKCLAKAEVFLFVTQVWRVRTVVWKWSVKELLCLQLYYNGSPVQVFFSEFSEIFKKFYITERMRTVAYVTSCFLPYASKLITDIYLSVILTVSHDNSIWKIETKLVKLHSKHLSSIKAETTILFGLKIDNEGKLFGKFIWIVLNRKHISEK